MIAIVAGMVRLFCSLRDRASPSELPLQQYLEVWHQVLPNWLITDTDFAHKLAHEIFRSGVIWKDNNVSPLLILVTTISSLHMETDCGGLEIIGTFRKVLEESQCGKLCR